MKVFLYTFVLCLIPLTISAQPPNQPAEMRWDILPKYSNYNYADMVLVGIGVVKSSSNDIDELEMIKLKDEARVKAIKDAVRRAKLISLTLENLDLGYVRNVSEYEIQVTKESGVTFITAGIRITWELLRRPSPEDIEP